MRFGASHSHAESMERGIPLRTARKTTPPAWTQEARRGVSEEEGRQGRTYLLPVNSPTKAGASYTDRNASRIPSEWTASDRACSSVYR